MAKIEIPDTVYKVSIPHNGDKYEVTEYGLFEGEVLYYDAERGCLAYEAPEGGWDLTGYVDCYLSDVDTDQDCSGHYSHFVINGEWYFYSRYSRAVEKAEELNVKMKGEG